MSIVVGLLYKGTAYIGSDSAYSNEHIIQCHGEEKVFLKSDMLFGFCSGSTRVLQVIKYSFKVPEKSGEEMMEWLTTKFVDALQACLADSNIDVSEKKFGGKLVVGIGCQIFEIQNDFSVLPPSDDVIACGSGYEFALGSLASSKQLEPEKRIELALQTATLSPFVRGPFIINKTEK